MIKRLYVHNFKCLINFEIHLAEFQLLAGSNGGGKSVFFDLLGRLKALICNSDRISQVFPLEDRSKGISGAEGSLKIELDLKDSDENLYRYALEVEYDEENKQQRILKEKLKWNQVQLFKSYLGEGQLYRDDGSQGPNFPMDWTQSGVGFIMPGKDNKKMTWFKKRLASIWIQCIVPQLMAQESRREAISPTLNMSDYADWYRFLAQGRPDVIYELTETLRNRIEGFRALRLIDAGEGKILFASFESDKGHKPVDMPFAQLSDGQKALIGLYSAFYGLFSEESATLCVDEPENFLALPEIQPWLDRVHEACEDEGKQVILISHHPRIINFLAAETGIWFERENGIGPTRIFEIQADPKSQISIDQLIERGWINGGQV